MKSSETEDGGRVGEGVELENMKVRVDGKVSNVMKVAAGKIYKGSERGRDGALALSASNKPPAVRVGGTEAGIPGRALSHLEPRIKPIFQPRDNKTQGY